MHCEALFSRSMSGSSAYTPKSPKAKLIWFDQKARKNKVRVITPIRVHVMGHWENHHMTNFQKMVKKQSSRLKFENQMKEMELAAVCVITLYLEPI